MKNFILIVLCLGLTTVPCLAASWKNIFPLKTTRAEVFKLLGEPKPFQVTGGEYFEVGNDRVFIRWTLANCFGKKLIIDEESAGPDALVHEIRVEPKNPKQNEYEEQVRQFLEIVKQKDCVGPRLGSCGLFDNRFGFGYSRSDLGITKLEYFADHVEGSSWRRRLKPCSTDIPKPIS